MKDPVLEFKADLEMITGQTFSIEFVRYAYEQRPDYVQSTREAAAMFRSNIKPISTQTSGVDKIKAKYRPIIERVRREELAKRRANQN